MTSTLVNLSPEPPTNSNAMEQHTLNFYQAQYQPSFDADQEKIDEWFGTDSLNTPDINPEFFTESNLFSGAKIHAVKQPKVDLSDDSYLIMNDLALGHHTNSTSAFDRSATYSPYSDKQLESSAININSPEMMNPVSPNKVCPQLDSGYGYEDEHSQNTYTNQLVANEYENLVHFDYSSPSTSACNSRSSSISAGSDSQTYRSEYLLSNDPTLANTVVADPTSQLLQLSRVPQSPASISSHYSAESASSKTFTNLETVSSMASLQQIVIKQEPDLYPTVVEEYENGLTSYTHQMPQQQQQSVSNFATINPTEIAASYYYPTVTNSLPSTVSSAIMQQQHTQSTSGQTSPTSRKRNAHAAFSSASAGTSSGSSTGGNKKPRMTKREKQKMMESDISKFENENRELRTSIDLLERQIQFCKRFLSENVAPVIQRQQQIHQFGSPQMVVVDGM